MTHRTRPDALAITALALAKDKELAIICPSCKTEITWGAWWHLAKAGDGTTDPELLEPGEEPETRHCTCGSTITVDLTTRWGE
jgi:hypothetical protein